MVSRCRPITACPSAWSFPAGTDVPGSNGSIDIRLVGADEPATTPDEGIRGADAPDGGGTISRGTMRPRRFKPPRCRSASRSGGPRPAFTTASSASPGAASGRPIGSRFDFGQRRFVETGSRSAAPARPPASGRSGNIDGPRRRQASTASRCEFLTLRSPQRRLDAGYYIRQGERRPPAEPRVSASPRPSVFVLGSANYSNILGISKKSASANPGSPSGCGGRRRARRAAEALSMEREAWSHLRGTRTGLSPGSSSLSASPAPAPRVGAERYRNNLRHGSGWNGRRASGRDRQRHRSGDRQRANGDHRRGGSLPLRRTDSGPLYAQPWSLPASEP